MTFLTGFFHQYFNMEIKILSCAVDEMFIEVPLFHKNFPTLKNSWLQPCNGIDQCCWLELSYQKLSEILQNQRLITTGRLLLVNGLKAFLFWYGDFFATQFSLFSLGGGRLQKKNEKVWYREDKGKKMPFWESRTFWTTP